MVNTYRLSKPCGQDKESKLARCSCGKPATYWSQAEDGHKPLGPVVYHCQACRNEGRRQAELTAWDEANLEEESAIEYDDYHCIDWDNYFN